MERFVYHHKHTRFRFHQFYERRKRIPICCVNCGTEGHLYRDCTEPITSFGIIAIRSNKRKDIIPGPVEKIEKFKCAAHTKSSPDDIPTAEPDYPILYFMVQRKDTMGYIDFLRGKYGESPSEKEKMLKIYLHEMTCEERERLRQSTLKTQPDYFEYLWGLLWCNHQSRLFINEFPAAKLKFEKLNVKKLLKETTCNWTDKEYGFPKGRRNLQESDIECAQREFREETGYMQHDIKILSDQPYEEIFVGTNGIKYRHVYYIAEVPDKVGLPRINLHYVQQSGEIANFGWFTFEQCMKIIRPYDGARKNLLEKVHKKYKNYFN